MCTLHSFPHNIDHCLTFARSEFEGLLEKAPQEANAFLTDPEKYIGAVRSSSDSAAHEQLEKVVEVLVTERCKTFEDCIKWARLKFQVITSRWGLLHELQQVQDIQFVCSILGLSARCL